MTKPLDAKKLPWTNVLRRLYSYKRGDENDTDFRLRIGLERDRKHRLYQNPSAKITVTEVRRWATNLGITKRMHDPDPIIRAKAMEERLWLEEGTGPPSHDILEEHSKGALAALGG